MIDYLNVPEHLLNQPIEPWQPQIGDRVRVRLNGECQAAFVSRFGTGQAFGTSSHIAESDGEIGTVSVFGELLISNPDHPFTVEFDKLIWSASEASFFFGAAYAACELEPLELPS